MKKTNKDKMIIDFGVNLRKMIKRHTEEVFWHGSVDCVGGFKLLFKHEKEIIELIKKYD